MKDSFLQEWAFVVFGDIGHYVPVSERAFGPNQFKNHLSDPNDFRLGVTPAKARNPGNEAKCGVLAVELARHARERGMQFACFDVGGYIGRFGLPVAMDMRSAGLDGQVHIFEPTPLHRLIERSAEINGLGSAVRIHRKAVSWRSAMGGYYAQPDNLISGRLYEFPKAELLYEVETTTLDAEWIAAGRPEVVLAKIDTEGHEVAVLAGALQMLAGAEVTLVLELWPWLRNEQIEGRRYADWLTERFEVSEIGYAIRPRGFTPIEDMDAFMDEVTARAPHTPTDVLCRPRSRGR